MPPLVGGAVDVASAIGGATLSGQCRIWLKGDECTRGEGCMFKHDAEFKGSTKDVDCPNGSTCRFGARCAHFANFLRLAAGN